MSPKNSKDYADYTSEEIAEFLAPYEKPQMPSQSKLYNGLSFEQVDSLVDIYTRAKADVKTQSGENKYSDYQIGNWAETLRTALIAMNAEKADALLENIKEGADGSISALSEIVDRELPNRSWVARKNGMTAKHITGGKQLEDCPTKVNPASLKR